jgi:uncharacterized protein (TIGR02246 family)
MRKEQAVNDVVEALEKALNGRDWTHFASNFAPDADAIVFESPRAGGRAAIREMIEEVWSEIPADVQASVSLESVRFVTPEVAVANLDAEFTGSAPFEDRATLVLRADGDKWLIEAFRVMQALGAASPA